MFDDLYYEAVFEYLLEYKHATKLRVDQKLLVEKSIYGLDVNVTEIRASNVQVANAFY
ncbi:hypothetical protein ACPUVO_13705 [Pseudocolwellia sp. HL-MZ19]|uniref:hypothetical protein n=1 Tax=Pseudocolwellia sp. HL-MZ19 TaxID=3400846 RepID=UPI003CF469FC